MALCGLAFVRPQSIAMTSMSSTHKSVTINWRMTGESTMIYKNGVILEQHWTGTSYTDAVQNWSKDLDYFIEEYTNGTKSGEFHCLIPGKSGKK